MISLIPFGAIILSQLLNGGDSIILLIVHNPIGSNLAESPPATLAAGLCQEDYKKCECMMNVFMAWNVCWEARIA